MTALTYSVDPEVWLQPSLGSDRTFGPRCEQEKDAAPQAYTYSSRCILRIHSEGFLDSLPRTTTLWTAFEFVIGARRTYVTVGLITASCMNDSGSLCDDS